jgi:ribonuclease-3
LTHRSYRNEHPDELEDNERLEFLGDAVLDFLVAAWLYQHYPEMSEGELTRLRAALVRTEQLADFGRQIAINTAIRLGKGEDENGGRDRNPLVCAAFEAVIGALYLDSGFSGVSNFITPMLTTATDQILASRQDQDPKSLLQEWVQSQGLHAPVYLTSAAYGPEHEKAFEVEVWIDNKKIALGSGSSKQAAEKMAASSALLIIGVNK